MTTIDGKMPQSLTPRIIASIKRGVPVRTAIQKGITAKGAVKTPVNV